MFTRTNESLIPCLRKTTYASSLPGVLCRYGSRASLVLCQMGEISSYRNITYDQRMNWLMEVPLDILASLGHTGLSQRGTLMTLGQQQERSIPSFAFSLKCFDLTSLHLWSQEELLSSTHSIAPPEELARLLWPTGMNFYQGDAKTNSHSGRKNWTIIIGALAHWSLILYWAKRVL